MKSLTKKVKTTTEVWRYEKTDFDFNACAVVGGLQQENGVFVVRAGQAGL